jgi:tetratricopeptide (TPR) repeat protein
LHLFIKDLLGRKTPAAYIFGTKAEEDFEKNYLTAVELVDGPHPEQAVQMLEDLIVRACEELAMDDETVISLRMYLGRAMWRSGVSARAIPILESALADAKKSLGWQHRVTFSCAGNLCRALGDVGRLDEAIRIAEDIYEKRVEIFGELDNGTLNSLGHMSQLMFSRGDVVRALQLISSLYEKQYQAIYKNGERTRSSWYNLTVMNAHLDNDEQSLLDLLAKYTAEYGSDHPDTIGLWAHLGGLLERTGKLSEALEVWREVEERRHKVFGEVAIPTLDAVGHRLRLQSSLGDDGLLDQIDVVRRTKALIRGQAI